jgi:hypothetical protein
MNDVQKAAIARADASMAPALALLEQRNKLAYVYYRLDLQSITRVNELLRILTDDELRMVAAYAEGLAQWRLPEPQSGDAPNSQAPTAAQDRIPSSG